MGFVKIVAIGILVLVAASIGGVEVMASKPPCNFPAIYTFGDSNTDTGAISAAFKALGAPNGENYFKKPAGRVCNGRLIIDFIAEHLRKPYLSAYLNSLGTNFQHGANFATGGSTIRRSDETIFEFGISPFSLDIQIEHYDQFKARTGDLYNQADSDKTKLPKAEDFSKALYIFDIGQNDLSVAFRKLSDEQFRAAIPDMINQLASAVQHLYEQGARSFWIHNTGPIGCLPVATLYMRNPQSVLRDQYGCIKSQNDMAVEFNRQLKDRVTKLRAELPQAALTYVDVYTAKYGLISNTKNRGFTDPLKTCCGYHENNVHVWCGQKEKNGTLVGVSCKTPSTHINWDGVHYTEAANHLIADQILNGSLSEPPSPITHACYKHPNP